MIKNETVYSKKDIQWVVSQRKYDPKTWIWCGIELLVAFINIKCGIDLAKIWMRSSSVFDLEDTLIMVLAFALAAVLILNVIFRNKLVVRKRMKMSSIQAKKITEADEEGITIHADDSGVGATNHFNYAVAERYFVENNALYIQVRYEKRKMFIILHDDGYTEGDRIGMIELLEKNNVYR